MMSADFGEPEDLSTWPMLADIDLASANVVISQGTEMHAFNALAVRITFDDDDEHPPVAFLIEAEAAQHLIGCIFDKVAERLDERGAPRVTRCAEHDGHQF
jgi:hypothetical protein